MFGVISWALTIIYLYAFNGDLLQKLGNMLSKNTILCSLLFSVGINIYVLYRLIHLQVKKKMSDFSDKTYFNLSVFKNETPAMWKALASLVNVDKEFTYSEVKKLYNE